jgi:hypothetical protein
MRRGRAGVAVALGVSRGGEVIVGAMTTPNTQPNQTVGFIAQMCDDAVPTCQP